MADPVAWLTRSYRFAASHRLHVDALTPEQNREVFGKCNNPFGHGHNYIVELTFSGPIDPATGMVTNLADLDAFAQQQILETFDHRNLNTLECFRDLVPSTENLSVEMWRIAVQYSHASLRRVRIEETPNNSFEYFGDGGAGPII
jgi:6-pyruvoyltetrahydropterin/6-carboxytetrahydropterin synthase